MTKTYLLRTAKELKMPGSESLNEYSQKIQLLVERMNNYMLNRDDISAMVGKENLDMMKDNHANHARFMESVFTHFEPEVLVDTILWVFRAYRSRDFKSTYWAAQLNGWIAIYKEDLSETSFNEIEPFYNWMLVNIPVFNELAEADIEAPMSSH